MRVTLADASLARYAGQFVWLELNFDKAENRSFFAGHAVLSTPTFFVIDPAGERVTATQLGAMTLQEVTQFLDRGARGVFAKTGTPAEAALVRGDGLLALNQPAGAANAFQEALRLAPATWPQRELAEASLVWALQSSSQWQRCAETAVAEAPDMKRDAMFGRIVVAGMWCVNAGEPEPWAEAAARTLEPLAEEAIAAPATVGDHRIELYRNLMYLSLAHNDTAGAAKWGDRCLHDFDATNPATNDERTALDIARVEIVSIFGDPSRILPALIISEEAMPNNYDASLRVAQMENAAKQYDEAIAACDRGLAHATGPVGRASLLETKAEALTHKGQSAEAQRVLEEASRTAQAITQEMLRQHNMARIGGLLKDLKGAQQEPEKGPANKPR